ncbi:porin [Vibrio sp. D431a]|uniref:porin n=1 Tax=Vibrio sp. D431a TaxID=2837388 RepID=UPI002556AC30|nr:porin [Vibrio sp. D431a]MDK9793244.1 porin [Vibrio sp. D431a]
MKKAILATLVSTLAVSGAANAATTEIASAELYGTVGVSYDSHNAQNTDRTDEINALRNTEFGIRGEVATTGKVSVAYDLRTEFDEADEKAYLSRANITLGTEFGNLTVGKAESSYDNVTRDFDKFDGHFTSDFEVFDAVDVNETVSFAATPVTGLDVALDIAKPESNEAKFGDSYALAAKYSIKSATFSAGYEKADLNEADESEAWKIGAGYDFAAMGVDGLSAGLTFENAEFNKDKVESIGFTAAYDVTADITVIAGYANAEFTAEGAKAEDQNLARFAVDYSITDNVTATAGFAHIEKDAKGENNEYMHTVGVKYEF